MKGFLAFLPHFSIDSCGRLSENRLKSDSKMPQKRLKKGLK